MALIKPGIAVADISGSVGGSTFARNRGGLYVRNRTSPLNPASPRQVAVRSRLADLTNVWALTLTAVQRDGWNQYADQVELPNAFGESRKVTGLNMYIRANSLLLEAGATRRDDPPTSFTVGPTITPTYTLDAAADTIQVDDLGGFNPAVQPVGMVFTQSPAQNPGVNFHASPFRLYAAQQFIGAITPPAIAATAAAFPFAAGQAVFLRSASVTDDGRVGVPVIQRFLAA